MLVATNSLGEPPPTIRMAVSAPADGVLVVAVTSPPDEFFSGSGRYGGAYSLSLHQAELIDGIGGSFITNTTGQAPTDYLNVELQFCEAGRCNVVQTTGSYDGSFIFPSEPIQPLFAGTYQVVVDVDRYEPLTIGPFEVAGGEFKLLDPATLIRIPEFSSISGRVMNAISGEPIRDISGSVTLMRCGEYGCGDSYLYGSIDPAGYFRFDAINNPNDQLVPGTYMIGVYAEQFEYASYGPFDVAQGQDLVLDDIALQPLPIQFFNRQGCDPIPASGGSCSYSIRIANGRDEPVHYRAWSIIRVSGASEGVFQPDVTKSIKLEPGEERVVRFTIQVPAGVPNNTAFAGDIYIAYPGEGYYFQPVAQTYVFWSWKGADGVTRTLPEGKTRERWLIQHHVLLGSQSAR